MSRPYTHEELTKLKSSLEESIKRTERAYPEARPVPPMTEDEAREMLLALTDTAVDRPLTFAESFLCGQLIAQYRMAVEARMLGRKGRFYVISEADVERAATR